MPQTIRCPNCKAPIHLRPHQLVTVCEYCGHQVKQTVAVQPPRPLPRPLPQPPQQASPERTRRLKRTLVIALVLGIGLPLLMSVGIGLIVQRSHRVATEDRALRNLGGSTGNASGETDADLLLSAKLGAHSKCLDAFSHQVQQSKHRYLSWVDRDAGPDCSSRCVSWGLFKVQIYSNSCEEALREVVNKAPTVEGLGDRGLRLLDAARRLQQITTDAYRYYNQKDYIDDSCAGGRAIHPKLLAAYEIYERFDGEIRAVIDKHLPALLQRRIASARRQAIIQATMIAAFLEVGVAARHLVEACRKLRDPRSRSDADLAAARALIAKLAKLDNSTLQIEQQRRPRQENWAGYFLFPHTYKDHYSRSVQGLIKEAKQLVRCIAGVAQCDKDTWTDLIEAYNDIIEGRGLGPKLLEDPDRDRCD